MSGVMAFSTQIVEEGMKNLGLADDRVIVIALFQAVVISK